MFKFVNELINKNVEQQSLLKARTNSLEKAENRIEELKHLRLQEQHNNEVLLKENQQLQQLLTEIADRTICCPLDSEKIVLAKIKELVRDYQSKN